jgi:CRP-like cAMP-binding protein
MISFNFLVPPQPLWVMVRWNVVMLLVNVVQIFIIIREKSASGMTDEEQELYATLFRTMSPMEFRRLMRLGVWDLIPSGRILVKQGEPVRALILVYNGAVSVSRDGHKIATLRDGAFVGEMSFMTEKPSSATITTVANTRILQWPRNALNRMLLGNPSMRISMQAVLGSDMAQKLGC